ncbi:hypothetical protein EYZ11_012812 [Aspergillus tanneri]|uniref:F-box domain-containing protein n=1 Tax=Aspergillus tanneri TaxID=1220188 RepID=A0A4V6RQM2_9EURO|nr:uncharacterized protein ATNIH1004_003597 [Aspergillus tanneri]KAA8650907.1 hypothetical protein ATNIH1004_003597 [Aspergillus tanneri]THC87744.1 hypothetical protein EYZ11_012812 [Aspergillus tanneri]
MDTPAGWLPVELVHEILLELDPVSLGKLHRVNARDICASCKLQSAPHISLFDSYLQSYATPGAGHVLILALLFTFQQYPAHAVAVVVSEPQHQLASLVVRFHMDLSEEDIRSLPNMRIHRLRHEGN